MAENNREVLLKVENLCQYFGPTKAVDDVSFEIYKGEVFSENAARERSERPERRQRRNDQNRRPQNRDGARRDGRGFRKNAEEGKK